MNPGKSMLTSRALAHGTLAGPRGTHRCICRLASCDGLPLGGVHVRCGVRLRHIWLLVLQPRVLQMSLRRCNGRLQRRAVRPRASLQSKLLALSRDVSSISFAASAASRASSAELKDRTALGVSCACLWLGSGCRCSEWGRSDRSWGSRRRLQGAFGPCGLPGRRLLAGAAVLRRLHHRLRSDHSAQAAQVVPPACLLVTAGTACRQQRGHTWAGERWAGGEAGAGGRRGVFGCPRSRMLGPSPEEISRVRTHVASHMLWPAGSCIGSRQCHRSARLSWRADCVLAGGLPSREGKLSDPVQRQVRTDKRPHMCL